MNVCFIDSESISNNSHIVKNLNYQKWNLCYNKLKTKKGDQMGKTTIQLRVRELLNEKEIEEGRVITQKSLSEECGIPESTLSRYMRGFVTHYNQNVLESLLTYFETSDMNDLFTITVIED